jgi:hypothetical protein
MTFWQELTHFDELDIIIIMLAVWYSAKKRRK